MQSKSIKSAPKYKFFLKRTYVLDNIYYEMQNIIDILDINHCLYHFLRNPFLNFKVKLLFLYITFHLEYFSSKIIRLIPFTTIGFTYSFMKLWNKKKKWVQINVITAIPLSNSIEEYLLEFFKKSNSNRKFFLEKKVNNSIIGGLRLRIEDKEWDSNLEAKILKLRIHFKNHI